MPELVQMAPQPPSSRAMASSRRARVGLLVRVYSNPPLVRMSEHGEGAGLVDGRRHGAVGRVRRGPAVHAPGGEARPAQEPPAAAPARRGREPGAGP